MSTTVESIPGVRELVTDGYPDERYPLPDKSQLRAGDGVTRAHDLGTIARTLIETETLPFEELAGLKIAFLWVEKGGLVGGFPAFGKMKKESKVDRHFSGFDYVASLAVDHLTTIKATRWQVEALIAHQLGHIAVATTEKGEKRYGTKGHDFEGFGFEFERYGIYLSGQVAGAESVAMAMQMGMVFEESEDDDEAFDPEVDLPAGVADELGPDATLSLDETPWSERQPGEEIDPDALESLNGHARGVDPNDYNGVNNERKRHIDLVRAAFGTRTLDDGVEVCARCGIAAKDHPVDVCAGGAPSQKIKPANLKDDAPNLDPAKVVQTLTEIGFQVEWEEADDGAVGLYVNPVTREPYSTQWVEGEYRGAINSTKREKRARA